VLVQVLTFVGCAGSSQGRCIVDPCAYLSGTAVTDEDKLEGGLLGHVGVCADAKGADVLCGFLGVLRRKFWVSGVVVQLGADCEVLLVQSFSTCDEGQVEKARTKFGLGKPGKNSPSTKVTARQHMMVQPSTRSLPYCDRFFNFLGKHLFTTLFHVTARV
jgi:hypothetical protein